MNCSLLALDLDGTLLDSQRRLSDDVAQSIASARKRGVRVVLCSGRMVCSVEPFWRQLGLDSPIIGYNGAYVRHPATGEVIFYEPVPLDLTLEVARLAKARGLHINIYIDDELWVAERNDYVRRYETSYGVQAKVVGNLERAVRQPSTKLLLVVEPTHIDRIAQELAERYQGRLFVTQSEDIHVELLNPRANKGAALEAVSKQLGLDAKDVVAVGDGINDIEMIRWAGRGVAVAHAKPQLQAEADVVLTPDPQALTTFLDSLRPQRIDSRPATQS
jgi:hypothetical protein